jgi:CheY-like chemotaxis protein
MQGYWQLVTESPDVVVVDLAMPNGSGTEMIECMMRNQVTRYIPVIVLTGRSEVGSQRRLFQLGISGFLRKPVACERLLRELGHYIDIGDIQPYGRSAADHLRTFRSSLVAAPPR